MSVRKVKGSPFYQYDFSIDGRRIRGSCKTVSKTEARIIENRKRSAIVAGAEGEQLTMETAFERYLHQHAHALPTFGNIAYQGRNLIAGLGKDTYLHEITGSAIAAYVTKRRGEVSDSSVNRELTLLRAVTNMAARRWQAKVPMIDWRAQRLREPAPRDRYLTPAEIQALLAEAADHIKPAILLSLYTGVRLSNCIGLDWSQVDMTHRVIHFRIKSVAPGGQPHDVPIHDVLRAVLAALGPRQAGPVFRYRGRAIKCWRKAFKRACERAGIEDFRWHDLRHTAASMMVQAGVPLDVVQDVLGHKDIATTRRYAHREDTAKRDAIDALGGKLAGDQVAEQKEREG